MTSLLQFFAMDAEEQLDYAKGIPLTNDEKEFPFGLDHSPLIEMANGTNNIANVLASDLNASPEAIEALEDFEEIVELILNERLNEILSWTVGSLQNSVSWRIVRKLSRECLQKLGIERGLPAIPYEELVPYVMD